MASSSRVALIRRLRILHRHVGLFFAPAILFFSGTGAVQTLGWHELPGGATPAWLAAAALIHKHQRLPVAAPSGKVAPDKAKVKAAAPREHVLLQAFVVLLGLALVFSTIAGIAIALHARASRRGALIALAAGTVVPLLLVL